MYTSPNSPQFKKRISPILTNNLSKCDSAAIPNKGTESKENPAKKYTVRGWKHLPGSARKCKSPFFPSPIDRIRIGINRRAEALGLNRCLEDSFESNQTFPRISKKKLRCYEIDLDTPPSQKLDNMDKIRVDGSNGLRFSLRRVKGCFTPGAGSPFSASLIATPSESLMRIPKSGINPNKAVFTIDSKSSQILIVNNNACQLLGYSSRELCNMQFSELLTNKNKSHVCALAEGQLNSEDGTMVLLSGKVVEMNTKSNGKVAVSLWIRQIDNDGRCLAVAEPVERRICQFIVETNGCVVSADYESLMIFQFDMIEQIVGLDITALIPAIVLPDADNSAIAKHIRKQKATGKTSDGISFPLCLLISHNDASAETTDSGLSNQSSNLYVITIWVFQNLSGLIVIDEFGIIESCNHHFSMLMFGYAQNKIHNQHISKLIPNFGQELEFLGMTRSRNATQSSLDNEESETETDPVYVDEMPLSAVVYESEKSKSLIEPALRERSMQKCENTKGMAGASSSTGIGCSDNFSNKCEISAIANENVENNRNAANANNPTERRQSMMISEACNPDSQYSESELLTPVNDCNSPYYMQENSNLVDCCPTSLNYDLVQNGQLDQSGLITSTPDIRKLPNAGPICPPKPISCSDGRYKGEAIHSDGNVIDILYTISSQILPCGRRVYCVWICRDPDTVYELDEDGRHQNLTLTFNSVTSTVEHSLGQAIKNTAAQNSSRPNSVSLMSQCEDEQVSGDFSKYYTTLKQIGKGAYGYVKMAYRNSDRLLVVAKFILKEKLCPQFMIVTEEKKEIPMEIYLLTTVKHPNIVTVYDVFENEKFFQLVMEKHGSGMDLFEFIDRRPLIDEKLGCYIFRQIGNAVNYLHSLNILHRDIKDENIIIDQNFHVKLIDFGSATFMEEGKLFSTFFGTTEYCSPEVLAGNKYAGPELEMWSLGVTLYVLMFFENPFIDVEETLRADLIMPHKVSTNLENLLYGMLDKDPRARYTMRQLMTDPWINQEINPAIFNFAWIVPCEPYEANPEKYYSGQVYSSTTGLSTTSPQDSLSLADEDSIIDGEEVDEDDEKHSIQLQEVKICDNLDKTSSVHVEELSAQLAQHATTTALDRTETPIPDLNASCYSEPLDKITGKQPAISMRKNFTPPKRFSQDSQETDSSFNSDRSSITHILVSCENSKYSKQNEKLLRIQSEDLGRTNRVDNLTNEDSYYTKNTDDIRALSEKDYKNNISSSLSKINVYDVTLNGTMSLSKSSSDFLEALSTTEQCAAPKKNPSSSFLRAENSQIILSKSENNIFEKKIESKLAIYDVVSLNDLNADDPFPHGKMNDLSKAKKVLNKHPDYELDLHLLTEQEQ